MPLGARPTNGPRITPLSRLSGVTGGEVATYGANMYRSNPSIDAVPLRP
jgi:hypothetical protein